jgi:para-nitrobenzyl esterase
MPARLSERLLAAIIAPALLVACSHASSLIRTPGGQLQGFVDADVEHYLGIPYAQPPVGALRWRAPQPVPPREGILAVQDNPSACAQFIPLRKSLVGSEDCLYLNVWTPAAKPAEPMPVMVWLHGGGFIVGQGSYSDGDGLELAAQNKVVVVTINYRLGVFGFMAHPALSEEDPAHPGSGNYGIEDQTAALRWVRDNISAFGGDPDRVTVFGQSAGAISVCAQLASPLAAGLFQRAVIQSGPCVTPLPDLDSASTLGDAVATGLGCDESSDLLACMRGNSAQAVADILAPDPTMGFNKKTMIWWPVQDDHVLPRQFMDAFESGQFNRVPVINGGTRDEGTLLVWMSHNLWFRPLQPEQYPTRLEYLLGSPELAEQVAERYPLQNFASPFDALSAAFGDGFFSCLSRRQGIALSRQVPTWSYQFDYHRAPFLIPWADLKAFHSAEIQYVFDKPMRFYGGEFRAEEAGLASSMMGYWTQFARSGDPNGGDRTYWPPYGRDDQTLLLNLQNRVATGVHAQDCLFWEELDYLRPVSIEP